DRVETAGADVFGAFIDERREIRDPPNRTVGESYGEPLGGKQRHVLLDQRALRFGQNPDEIFAAERLELDADRKPPLELRNQIGRLGYMERAGRDEQNV